MTEGDEVIYNEPEKPEEVQTVGWEIYKEQKLKIEEEKRKLVESSKKEPLVSNAMVEEAGQSVLSAK